MQMLVYENYNKFISATETIRHMKLNIESMYSQTQQFANRMSDIGSSAEEIDKSIKPQLDAVSKLVRVRRLMSRLEFLSELPERLERLIGEGRYETAVKLYKESIGKSTCLYTIFYSIAMCSIYNVSVIYFHFINFLYIYIFFWKYCIRRAAESEAVPLVLPEHQDPDCKDDGRLAHESGGADGKFIYLSIFLQSFSYSIFVIISIFHIIFLELGRHH